MNTRSSLTLLLIVTCGAPAAVAHDDIVPYVASGKLFTGGHDDLDVDAVDKIAARVFGYDFGENPGNPYAIGDPGFNNGTFTVGTFPNNGLLPANRTLGMDLLTNLQFWNGADPVSFGPAPVGVTLDFQNAATLAQITVGGTGAVGAAPDVAGTGANGRVHVHFSSRLNFTDGFNPAEPNAPDGIYLLGLRLKLSGGDVADSDPLFIVYNNNAEEAHGAAIDWVQTHLVPEPASWWLMTGAVAALLLATSSRRRHPAR